MLPKYLAPALVSFSCVIVPLAQAVETLPADTPSQVGGIEAVCTGVGLPARQDARWSAYPLKIEIAGQHGQYLGDVTMAIASGEKEILRMRCDGPWILLRLPPGRYQVQAETEGKTAQSSALVPQTGQARVILRFPELGGQISP